MAINAIQQNLPSTAKPTNFPFFRPQFPTLSNETRIGLAYTGALATAYPLVGVTPVSAAALLGILVFLLYRLAASAASKLAQFVFPAAVAAGGLAAGISALEVLSQIHSTTPSTSQEWTEEFLEIEESAPEEPWVKEFDDFVDQYKNEQAALQAPQVAVEIPPQTAWATEFNSIASGTELATQFFATEVAQMVNEFFQSGDWAGEFLG